MTRGLPPLLFYLALVLATFGYGGLSTRALANGVGATAKVESLCEQRKDCCPAPISDCRGACVLCAPIVAGGDPFIGEMVAKSSIALAGRTEALDGRQAAPDPPPPRSAVNPESSLNQLFGES